MTAERVTSRRIPKSITASELITYINRDSIGIENRDLHWMLNELNSHNRLNIPERLIQKMGLAKFSWYKISRIVPDNSASQLYLGYPGRLTKRDFNLDNVGAVIMPEGKIMTSFKLFGNIKDFSGVRRVVALTYSVPNFHLSSAAFSLPDVNQSIDLLGVRVGRFIEIPSVYPNWMFATRGMIEKTERVLFATSGFVRHSHRYLVTMDDQEIRSGSEIRIGMEDHATFSVRSKFRDYLFTFHHQPLEGRVNLGNWKISVPKKLS